MPLVSTSVHVQAPLEKVYAIAKEPTAFLKFLEDVESITVLEKTPERVLSDWVGILSAFKLKVRWQQEDLWDDANYVCTFRQTKGDYTSMSGVWAFATSQDGTEIKLDLDYEYDVPTLGALIKKVVQSIVKKNLEALNRAVKQAAEAK